MAVSGRKFRGFKDCLSVGCEEDIDICCDPCKHLGQSVEAKGFCVNCQENLCKRCEHDHKGSKLCRHHRILDHPQKVPPKTTAATDDSRVCTEYCDIHKKEIIEFFCQKHDKVGCTNCITLVHKTCRIDYIPDICSGTLTSKELSGTLQKVSATINEANLIVNMAQKKKDKNKTNTETLLEEIEKYQKKINDKIEQLKQQLVKEANSHKANGDQDVDKIADTCADVSSELKQIHTYLIDCQVKKLDAQAFVTMKKARSILDTTNIQTYRNKVTNVLTNIFFEPNDQLENILTQPNALGRLLLKDMVDAKPTLHIDKTPKARAKTEKETKFDLHSIEQTNNIEVKTGSDGSNCRITGCALISADRLLLADYENSKLKVVNIDTHLVVEEMNLDICPWDITVLPQNQAAVTLPHNEEVLILGTVGKISRIRSLQVGRKCWGIVYHKDHLYIVCRGPYSLLVLDMQGNVQRDIELKAALDQTFNIPLYIAVGKDGLTIYISDWNLNLVASLTLHGKVTGVYRHDELRSPSGMVVLEDGSLLVCCPGSCSIHQISADLKQGRTLTADVPEARSICYNTGNSQIYVGSVLCNQIKVFCIQ